MELWKTDAFQRWWVEDWSWDGLGRKNGLRPPKSGSWSAPETLQDVWREEESELVDFGVDAEGNPRRWTRFHLPPCDPSGYPCPLEQWTKAKHAVASLLHARAELAKMPDEGMLTVMDLAAVENLADLRGVVFPQAFAFAGDVLVADLSSAIFTGPLKAGHRIAARFEQVVFLSGADFSRAVFCGTARFDNAVFLADVSFAAAIFSNDASFKAATCSGDASFNRAVFSKNGWFNEAAFAGRTEFVEATFAEKAEFSGAGFSGDAVFNVAKFSGEASFIRSAFSGEARFLDAAFASGASFSNATFAGLVWFYGAVFEADVTFWAPTKEMFAFSGMALFEYASFRGTADFGGRMFLARTDFTGAVFEGPALFHGAQLHPETAMDGRAFDLPKALRIAAQRWFADNQRASAPKWLGDWRRLTYFGRFPFRLHWPGMKPLRAHIDKEMNRYELAFRTLRLQFARHQNTEYEMMFYGLELDARRARASIPFLFEGMFAWLYKITSNYGQNMLGPVVWFLGVLTTGGAFVLSLLDALVHVGWRGGAGPLLAQIPSHFREAWTWLLELQVPLLIWGDAGVNTPPRWFSDLNLHWLEVFLRVFLPATSIGLLTVFLIALRRRFQIDRG